MKYRYTNCILLLALNACANPQMRHGSTYEQNQTQQQYAAFLKGKASNPLPANNPNTWYPFAAPTNEIQPLGDVCHSDFIQTGVSQVISGLGYPMKTVETVSLENDGINAKCKLILTGDIGRQELLFTGSLNNQNLTFDQKSMDSIEEFRRKYERWSHKRRGRVVTF